MEKKKLKVVNKTAWYSIGASIPITILSIVSLVLFSSITAIGKAGSAEKTPELLTTFSLVAAAVANIFAVVGLYVSDKSKTSGIFSAVLILHIGAAVMTMVGGEGALSIIGFFQLVLGIVFDSLYMGRTRDASIGDEEILFPVKSDTDYEKPEHEEGTPRQAKTKAPSRSFIKPTATVAAGTKSKINDKKNKFKRFSKHD